eukprot:gnl/TRDRNA2_/TRDRNA2_140593_c0_seq3.p1 gnl/TRDRNA2_/TRDRNA2_140593_c0~~gnl/TRDRNA2_/TRDRNA2_140593_c0_seq3.p1  ORF type:complete len:338 (-),score=67.35 gnl/TRDRNA2_/TRDRNA2_140593_c0_seq3:190-1203(-)
MAMMKKFFEAAFRPPPRPEDAAADSSRFAVLPQQSEDELALSEVHTRLDAALNFLQRNVGYSLLDDARSLPSGAAGLSHKPYGGLPDIPREERSAKEPKEFSETSGWARAAAAPVSTATGSEEGTNIVQRLRSRKEQELSELDVKITSDAELAKYAHYQEDLMLVSRFVTVISQASPSCEPKVKHEALYKTVLQGLRLMHLCDYDYADVVLVLAHASVYFRSTFDSIGHKMSPHEAAHVSVLLMYLAHSFLLDETCPLRCWQKHIFRKYCTLKVLDAALFRLFKMRGFLLRITQEEEMLALRGLFGVDVALSSSRSSRSGTNHNTGTNGPVSRHAMP